MEKTQQKEVFEFEAQKKIKNLEEKLHQLTNYIIMMKITLNKLKNFFETNQIYSSELEIIYNEAKNFLNDLEDEETINEDEETINEDKFHKSFKKQISKKSKSDDEKKEKVGNFHKHKTKSLIQI